MPSEACVEELETLSAIFLDEITINDAQPDGGVLVSMVLYPATGDDEDSRYVTVSLEISLCKDYPKVLPKILFRNPRGLNDVMLEELLEAMKYRCEERLDSQMIYELIDMGKEFLTKNNRPASECPICLLSFTEFDVFFRSRCFHHFHSYCLGNYFQNLLTEALTAARSELFSFRPAMPAELLCPVCREDLDRDVDMKKLLSAPPPSEETEVASAESTTVLQDWEDKRQSMQELFEKQKNQGGIIDLTDKNKLLVISSPQPNSSTDADNPPSEIPARGIPTAAGRSFRSANFTQAFNSYNAGRHEVLQQRHPRSSHLTSVQISERQHTTSARTDQGSLHGSQPLGLSASARKVNNSCPAGDSSEDQARTGDRDNRASNGNGHYKKRGGGGYNRRRHK